MLVRFAVPADADAIATVHIASWRETYTGILPPSLLNKLDVEEKKHIWKAALERNQPVFVAEHDGHIIGFTNGAKNRDKASPYPGEIYTLYVLKSFHRQGVGRKLFGHMHSYFVSNNLFPFVAWTLANNPALSFYQRMGGQIIGERMEDFDGLTLKELQLIWNTPPNISPCTLQR